MAFSWYALPAFEALPESVSPLVRRPSDEDDVDKLALIIKYRPSHGGRVLWAAAMPPVVLLLSKLHEIVADLKVWSLATGCPAAAVLETIYDFRCPAHDPPPLWLLSSGQIFHDERELVQIGPDGYASHSDCLSACELVWTYMLTVTRKRVAAFAELRSSVDSVRAVVRDLVDVAQYLPHYLCNARATVATHEDAWDRSSGHSLSDLGVASPQEDQKSPVVPVDIHHIVPRDLLPPRTIRSTLCLVALDMGRVPLVPRFYDVFQDLCLHVECTARVEPRFTLALVRATASTTFANVNWGCQVAVHPFKPRWATKKWRSALFCA